METNIDSFFKPTESVMSLDEEDIIVKKKSPVLFSYLNDITFSKTGLVPEKEDPEMKGFNKFMILRYLSLDSGYLPIVAIFSQYSEVLTSRQLYDTLVAVIPRSKKFLKYPELKAKEFKDEEIDYISKYFDCTKADVLEYLEMGLLSLDEKEKILTSFGINNNIKKGRKSEKRNKS